MSNFGNSPLVPGSGRDRHLRGFNSRGNGGHGDLAETAYESGKGENSEFHQKFWEVLRLTRRRKAIIAVMSIIGAAAGMAIRLPRVPAFKASTAVEVQAVTEDFGFSKDSNANAANMFPDIDLATQARVMRSKVLRDRVISKLVSDEHVQVQFPRDRYRELAQALHISNGPVGVKDPDKLRASMIEDAVESLQVAVTRNSRIMEITCQSSDAKLAALASNTLASEYIDQSLETRWQSAKHTGEWLGRQMDDMKVKLEKSEEQLQGYATAMNLVVTGGKDNRSNVSDEKLRQLQTELSGAEADRIAKQAKFEMASSTRTESLGQLLDDQTLRADQGKLTDLRREMAELSTTLTPAHPKVKKLQAQIGELETAEKSYRQRVLDRIQNDFREAERREKLLSTKYAAQSGVVSAEGGKLIRYNLLQREVDTNRQLYEALLQKVKEAGISAALRASNIRVVDPAQVPPTPYSPDLSMAGALGWMVGLCGGFMIAILQEKVSRSIEAPADALFHLNVPLLGAVPARNIDGVSSPARLLAAGSTGPSVLTDFDGSRSAMAEAFRSILTSILFTGRRQAAQVLVVASPGASEGKTTVTSNLALAFAEANRSVLLIDCDMRRPRLHDVFNVPNKVGLAGALADKSPMEARSLFLHLHGTDKPGVTVLPSGTLDSGAANLLHSRRFEELIALAREHFDIVLLDTPPLLQLADARIVGALADGVVLVVRAGQTMRDSAVAARQQLEEDGIPVLGVVLNDWDPKAVGYYGYEYYGHSYYSTAQSDTRIPTT